MVTQRPLEPLFMVRIHAGQPLDGLVLATCSWPVCGAERQTTLDYRKRVAAFSTVLKIPHASGIPTSVQPMATGTQLVRLGLVDPATATATAPATPCSRPSVRSF